MVDIRDAELAKAVVDAPLDDTAVDGLPTATAAVVQSRSGPRRWPRLSGKLLAGLFLTLAIIAFGVFGPLFTQDPRYSGNPSLQPPSLAHPLGTTQLGYDVLAQLAHGTQGSLTIGLLVGLITIALSVLFGVVAGYVGGWTDEVLSLVTNIMLVIPGLPLMIVIASYVPTRSLVLVALILGVTGWAGSAIVLRSQARSIRSRDYVAAARVADERGYRIVLVEILPNLLPLLAAQFLFAVVFAILGEAGLSYLGLGPVGTITWGTILNEAQLGTALSSGAWWWFVPPGLLIALFGCGLALINFAIDEVINPKLRLVPQAARSARLARRAGLEPRQSQRVRIKKESRP